MKSIAPILVILSLASGCASVKPVDVEVAQVVNIDCGPEPVIDRLSLLPHDPIGFVDDQGEVWVVFSVDHYENMGTNLVRVQSRFEQDATVIRHYRSCIEDFNGALEEPAAMP